MRALAQSRARIARVRQVQHLQAANVAASAAGKVVQLENNAERLTALRASLCPAAGAHSGAALRAAGELANRLDDARRGLDTAIVAARDTAALRVAERIDADVRREGAERLETRAVAALQDMIERRMAAAIRPNRKAARND